jgi:hypothetical protein
VDDKIFCHISLENHVIKSSDENFETDFGEMFCEGVDKNGSI